MFHSTDPMIKSEEPRSVAVMSMLASLVGDIISFYFTCVFSIIIIQIDRRIPAASNGGSVYAIYSSPTF